jgi:hypothetical protein
MGKRMQTSYIKFYNDELFCPHCGVKVISPEETFIVKCPHLVFVYCQSLEVNGLMYTRKDYLNSYLDALLASTDYLENIKEMELEPLTQQQLNMLRVGEFEPLDETLLTLEPYCDGMLPNLLSENTAIFVAERTYSAIYVAIDLGE